MDVKSKYCSWEQLAVEMLYDFDRYPLPFVMQGGYAEVVAMWKRDEKIRAIARRWFRRFGK